MSKLAPDDFFQLFKSHRGEDFERIVRTSLQFSNMDGTGEEERAISARASEALVRIGRESLLNRRRVKKFGVVLDDEAPQEPVTLPPRVEQTAAAQVRPARRRSRAERLRPN